jgi:hypothetical protein
MPSAEYFRRQADICLRLSLIASDDEVSSRLIIMAREYMATGDALANEAAAVSPIMDQPTGSPQVSQGAAAPGGAMDTPDAPADR